MEPREGEEVREGMEGALGDGGGRSMTAGLVLSRCSIRAPGTMMVWESCHCLRGSGCG